LAGLILVFVAIIFVIFYSGRRKAILLANHEFERFITYVCQTNAAVFRGQPPKWHDEPLPDGKTQSQKRSISLSP
jgi:lipopolysaccharide biosynthesis protein